MPGGRARMFIIGGAVAVVVIVAIAAASLLGGDDEPASSPAPTEEPELHYLVHLDRALTTFGTATLETSGVIRISNGPDGVEVVSLAIDPIETASGPTGPVSVALTEQDADVDVTGSDFKATFDVELLYPLLYQAVGETVTGDVVHPRTTHPASATFEASVDGDQWTGTLTIAPGALEGSDLTLPSGEIQITTPVVYETESQFTAANGGVHVYCIDVQRDAGAFSDAVVDAALKDMRAIWRTHGKAFLTREEIDRLNTTVLSLEPGTTETRDPGRIPTSKCYTVRLVRTHERGDGLSTDVAGRLITIGANALRTCPESTLGRLLAHATGHAALRLNADATSGTADNLMRTCAPGTSLEPAQLATQWSFIAEVAPEVTLPEEGSRQNAVFNELETQLDTLVGVGASPSPEGSPSPSPAATGTPRATSPTRTATPSATRTPSPTPTRSPSPTPTRSPTPTPTGGASPTPTPTGGASPTPTASPTAGPTASPSPTPTATP